jgi:hypothetical protein
VCREDYSIGHLDAGRKLDAYARSLWGRCEAEGDVDGKAAGGAAARQRVRVGNGGGAAIDLERAVVLEHYPWRVGLRRRHPIRRGLRIEIYGFVMFTGVSVVFLLRSGGLPRSSFLLYKR